MKSILTMTSAIVFTITGLLAGCGRTTTQGSVSEISSTPTLGAVGLPGTANSPSPSPKTDQDPPPPTVTLKIEHADPANILGSVQVMVDDDENSNISCSEPVGNITVLKGSKLRLTANPFEIGFGEDKKPITKFVTWDKWIRSTERSVEGVINEDKRIRVTFVGVDEYPVSVTWEETQRMVLGASC